MNEKYLVLIESLSNGNHISKEDLKEIQYILIMLNAEVKRRLKK